jgi:hypothetical protein
MLERELVLEACLEFWEEYHTQIEDLGYKLSKDGMMHTEDGIFIMAVIRPAYSDEDGKTIRDLLPMEYLYKDKNIKVGMSPSMESLFDNSPKIFY